MSSLGKAFDAIRREVMAGRCHVSSPIDVAALGLDAKSPDVRSAFLFLAAEGLVEERKGQVFVVEKPARSKRATGFIDDYAKAGRLPVKKTISLGLLPLRLAAEHVQVAFAGSNVAMVIRHLHVQIVDGVPHAICDSYIPYEPFQQVFERLEDPERDLFDLMGECSLRPDRKREALRVDVPTQEERELLEIEDLNRVMVVRLDCLVWSGDQLVEVCDLVDRADLYEFTYEVGIG